MRGKLRGRAAASWIRSSFNEARALCAGNSIVLLLYVTTVQLLQ